MNSICAVIVTFNRKNILEKCLVNISNQTLAPNHVLIVDNASTDGTERWLRDWLPENIPKATLVSLSENCGGAGGFSQGLQLAFEQGAEWVWLMDDDAKPRIDALEKLSNLITDPGCVYGSIAISGEKTAWTTTLLGPPTRTIDNVDEIPAYAEVKSLPFLGFCIHRELVHKLGFPKAGYFIAADDIEYCLRARRAGAKLYIAGDSRIEHPRSTAKVLRLFGQTIVYLSLAPWKRYYDTRNRILIAKEYYGLHLLTQTIPGSFVRLLVALRREPQKLAQLWAFTAGLVDGLLGFEGKRHEKWRISQ